MVGNLSERTSHAAATAATTTNTTTKTHFSTSATTNNAPHGINSTDINAIRAYNNQDTLGEVEDDTDTYSDVSDDDNNNLTNHHRSITAITITSIKTTIHNHNGNNDNDHGNDADSDVSEYEVADEDLEEAEAMAGIEQEMMLFSQQQRAEQKEEEKEEEEEKRDYSPMQASDNVYLQENMYDGDEGGSSSINNRTLHVCSDKLRGLLTSAMVTTTVNDNMTASGSTHSITDSVVLSASNTTTTAIATTSATATVSLKRPHQPAIIASTTTIDASVHNMHSHQFSLETTTLTNLIPNSVATALNINTISYSQGDRSPAPKVPKLHSDGPAYAPTQRPNLSVFPSFSYKPTVNLPPAAAAASHRLSQRTTSLSQTQSQPVYVTTLSGIMQSQYVQSQYELPTYQVPQEVPNGVQALASPLQYNNNINASGRKQHRVVFSPITTSSKISTSINHATTIATTSTLPPHTNTLFTAAVPMEYQFLVTDAELNALMEELESAGVMECVNAEPDNNYRYGDDTAAEANMSTTVDLNATTVQYHYYPLENMHTNDHASALASVSSPMPITTNTTHANVTITSSAFKMTVQRVATEENTEIPGDNYRDNNMSSFMGSTTNSNMDIDIYDTDDTREMTIEEVAADRNTTISPGPTTTSTTASDADAAAMAFELAIIQMMEDLEARGVIPVGSASHGKRSSRSNNNNSNNNCNSRSRYGSSATKTSMDDSVLYYNHTLPYGADVMVGSAIASPVLPPQPPLLSQSASLMYEDNSFDDFYNAASDECMDYEHNNVNMSVMFGAEDSRESVTGYSVGLKESFSLSVNINNNNNNNSHNAANDKSPLHCQIASVPCTRMDAFSPTAMTSNGLQNGSSSVRERAKQTSSLSGQRGPVRFDIDHTADGTRTVALGSGERTVNNSTNSYYYKKYTLHSPYATPFTPSKVQTPGRYLYYPLWQQDQDSNMKSTHSEGNGGAVLDSPIVGSTLPSSAVMVVRQYPSDCVPPEVIAPNIDKCATTNGSNIEQPSSHVSPIVSNPAAHGFGMRNVSNPLHCRLFTEQLRTTRCVSFELLYRPLPASWLARYKPAPSGMNTTAAAGYSVYSWTPYISYACCKASSVTGSNNDHFLDCSLSTDSGQKRNMFRSPHVVVGVSICFGDAYGYYLPLPTPLPLPPNPETCNQVEKNRASASMEVCDSTTNDGVTTTDSTVTFDSLPARCREIIVAYVGFGALLTKCTTLSECMMESKSHTTNATNAANTTNTTHTGDTTAIANPLFLVNRRWSYSARRALLLAWRRGGCTEWRLFSDVLSNVNITKVAVHLKSKMVVLRERDVLIEGPIEDPSIAHTLLQHCMPRAEKDTNTSGEEGDTDGLSVSLQIPEIPHDPSTLTALHHGQKIACFRSVAVFRAMARLEVKLRSVQCIDLFRNIEMSLLFSASDAEYSGLRVDAAFFSALRKQLSDRQSCIEQYFATLYGGDFNVSSHSDVALLRKRLVRDNVLHVQNVIANSKGGMVGFIDDTGSHNVGAESTLINGNNNCNSNSNSNNTITTAEIEQSIAHCIQTQHPLLQLISEHRSHTRALPLCSSVLGSRCFDRVRAVYSTLGTETGRIILTNPPLQQVIIIMLFLIN